MGPGGGICISGVGNVQCSYEDPNDQDSRPLGGEDYCNGENAARDGPRFTNQTTCEADTSGCRCEWLSATDMMMMMMGGGDSCTTNQQVTCTEMCQNSDSMSLW